MRHIGLRSAAFADAALISGANFTTVVVIARMLAPSAFGSWSLVYAGLLLAGALQWSLVTQPHNVLGSRREGRDYRVYTSACAFLQVAVVGAGVGVCLVAAAVAAVAGSGSAVFVAAAAALLATQAQEFQRRVLYTEGRTLTAFSLDAAAYGLQLALIVAAAATGVLSPAVAFLCAGTAFGVVAVATMVAGRGRIVLELNGAAVRENLAYGKWLLGAEASFWLSSQVYLYLAAIALGVHAAGTLKALVLLLGPLNVVLMYVSTSLPITLAKLDRENGAGAVDRALGMTQVRLGLVFVAYGAAVTTLARPLLDAIYGGRYVEHASTVAFFALQYVLLLGLQTLSAALRARQQTHVIFMSYVASSLVALVGAFPLMRAFGIEGAAMGMLASTVASSLVCWLAYARTRRRDESYGAPFGSEATP
jgi:O-antigen/teichoic acid export membrane protein